MNRAQRPLDAIAWVVAYGMPVWLRGGWALDFSVGEITRAHGGAFRDSIAHKIATTGVSGLVGLG